MLQSHTWGTEEVLFHEFQEQRAAEMRGYGKITGCCRQAASDGLDYLWIDTCCIDKRSSSELSEAINSMFSWYRDAAICYAYLEDVDGEQVIGASIAVRDSPFSVSFSKSRWFRRGWTLQELLAPSLVVFYSADWSAIGSREELKDTIAQVTSIEADFLGNGKFEECSIAQRMSWASGRETTRIEDQAYCLLGLFGVNMPLLYGEKQKAFMRLQQEIMKESDDQSIFAWTSRYGGNSGTMGGILASSPSQFAGSGHIRRSKTTEFYPPYAITNKGVQISLPVFGLQSTEPRQIIASRDLMDTSIPSVTLTMSPRERLAVLNCQSSDDEVRIGIILDRSRGTEPYFRAYYDLELITVSVNEIEEKATQTDLIIHTHYQPAESLARPLRKADGLVLIQPFHHPSTTDFVLHRMMPDMKRQQKSDHGPLAIQGFSPLRWPKFSVLEFRNSSGHAFLLVLRMNVAGEIEAFIDENAEIGTSEGDIDCQAHAESHKRRIPGHTAIYQKSSNGPIYLVPRVRQARHATLVSIEAHRRPQVESNASSTLKIHST
ncbi:heterokaryon incompatibility protein-domain-containing protein [Hypoxylon argillaceum]|nr:heterokaryon incompatibility protein-domain-containing protein [Hypoxylon argillaceum]